MKIGSKRKLGIPSRGELIAGFAAVVVVGSVAVVRRDGPQRGFAAPVQFAETADDSTVKPEKEPRLGFPKTDEPRAE